MTEAHLSCSPVETKAALADAESLCLEKGLRLTPIRKRVLELLLEADAPAKAYDLLDKLGDEGAAKPPTIYRALDFLLEIGLAHKIESLNAFMACGHRHHRHAAAFLICTNCETAHELHTSDTLQAIERETDAVHFKMKSVVIEVRGLCAACQMKLSA